MPRASLAVRTLPWVGWTALSACYGGVSFEPNATADAPIAEAGADTDELDPDGSASSGDGPDSGTGEDPQTLCENAGIGVTHLRRLTAAEYDNTIADLIGLTDSYAASFSPDERVGPFASNVAAPITELLVEQYREAAEQIAQRAIEERPGLVPCDPEALGEDACADAFIEDFGRRAYRRPLDTQMRTRLRDVYRAGREDGSFADGIELVIAAALQSPHFLYHIEVDSPDDVPGDVVSLDGYALASRLSYFLWSSMPDDELFSAAEDGLLQTEDGLWQQAQRLLEDARAAEGIGRFHTQWLRVDELERQEKDPVLFEAYSPSLAAAMKAEVESFATHVFFEDDARLESLLTASYTSSDDPELLALYGASLPPGHRFGDPVPLDPTQRAGLITLPGLLARHAHANQTSPVHRGVLLRQDFLCQPLPPPPPDVDNVPPDPDPSATTRERFAEHTSNPDCGGCHRLIDPLGFGLEGYDAIGAYRTMEGDLPVDASGELVSTDVDGPFDGGVELAHRLAQSRQVSECVARQWFRYGLGRTEQAEDECTIAQMHTSMEAAGNDLRVLVLELVMSDAFRLRRAAKEGEEDA